MKILMKIKSFFEKLLNHAKVDDGSKETKVKNKQVDKRSIEKKFYESMISYFKDIIVERSVGKRMVFHMGYIVWLEPSDYAALRDELIVIVPEVVDGFYDIIKEQSRYYPKCVPASTDWFFQITPTDIVTKDNTGDGIDEIVNLKKGEFIISSTFHSMNRAWSNVQQQANVTLSFRPQNSNVTKDMNVNKDLILGIESLGGAFSQPFDYTKIGQSVSRTEVYGAHGFAKLEFKAEGGNATYTVKDRTFFVSGAADQRKQYNVLVLPDASVAVGHLAFRYKEDDDCFEVAAYGYTVLNERRLKLSTTDEPVWYRVSAKASFLLGDGVGLTYTQNKIKES